jgi:heptosyltransferase II
VLDRVTPPNVLAVRFSSIGDVLLTTPLLRAIRRRHPGSGLTVLTKQAYAPLLSHNPHVTRVIGVTPNRRLMAMAAELRTAGYTHLLDLHDSVRTRLLRLLVPGPWTTYPKHRLARAALIHTKRNHYRDSRAVAERYFDAARDLDVAPDGEPPDFFLAADAQKEATTWLQQVGLTGNHSVIALAPGAAHATKRWPPEHWRELMQRIGEQGFAVVIVGGSDDAALGATLTSAAPGRAVNAAGLFGLQGTAALLQRATALVSGDTGVMHMATAVGTPVVALFGPTVEPFGFFPYSPRAQVVELGLPCRPCSSKGGPRCPLGHHRCLVDISPDRVHEVLRRCIS